MKVLLTGSAGRVGRVIAETLLVRGDTVVGFDKISAPWKHPRFTQIEGDLADAQAVQAACAGADAVLHIGAYMTWLASEQAQLFEANVTGTLNVLAGAQSEGVKKFVFASSGEVYPDRNPAYLPIDEAHSRQPTSPYGLSKKMAEDAVRFHERVHGLRAVILRFSHTQDAAELLDENSFFSGSRFYLHAKIRQQRGFGNEALAKLLETHDDGENKLVISCNSDGRPHRMGISDTRDTAAGVIRALDVEAACGETFNLAPPAATSFDEAVEKLREVKPLDVIRINIPGPDLYYESDDSKARRVLGLEPQWTFAKMVADASNTLA